MNALTTAVVPANVIRQVFTEALERLEATWDERMEKSKLEFEQSCAKNAADLACFIAKQAAWGWANGMGPSVSDWGKTYALLDHNQEARAYYTLMLYTMETNAVVHMTQEQIQRMQQVDAENKAARKDGVRDGG